MAAHSEFLPAPLTDAGANPLCPSFKAQPEDRGENGKSLGDLLRAGKFEFVNLGDLSWNFQHRLACPRNLLGNVDSFRSPITVSGTMYCRSRCGRWRRPWP